MAVQYYADAKVVLNVSANCFMPRPNVDSAVIKLTRHTQQVVSVADEGLMFRIIRASFNQRRKTLVNGLKNSSELDFTKEQIADAIKAIGKDENIRGEKLTLEEFAMLSNAPVSYTHLDVYKRQGYTAYFVELAGELQDEIIARTSYDDI